MNIIIVVVFTASKTKKNNWLQLVKHQFYVFYDGTFWNKEKWKPMQSGEFVSIVFFVVLKKNNKISTYDLLWYQQMCFIGITIRTVFSGFATVHWETSYKTQVFLVTLEVTIDPLGR